MKPKRFYFRTPSIFGTPLKCGASLFIGFTVLITGLDAQGGDILRGGSSSSNKPGRAAAGAPTPAASAAARANAKDTLARTTRSLDAARAMQNAARNAAIRNGVNHLGKNPNNLTVTLPNVPNGLGTGGLKVAPTVPSDPTKWIGAKLPTQTVKNGRTKVTIKQTEQQALLNWETFNVGKKTTVTFDQSKGGADVGKWIAFNKINDPSGNPTQILGNIKADGQVYLINSNGIIFGGSSQVNARGLTASSLPINDNLVGSGLLNNPDAQFLFSGLTIPAGANGTPAFTPEAALDPSGKYGDVTVLAGAVLKSPTNEAKVGGRITLVGPNVTNNGTILTPDGQAILAAGLQVGFDAHPSSDPSLRGLDVYVGSVEDAIAGAYAGSVNQSGMVEAKRGSITIGGKAIKLDGVLSATTSVSLNGRIDLNANYNAINNPNSGNTGAVPFLFRQTGSVELGPGSLISILPEYENEQKVIGTTLALRSSVGISGKTIHLGESSVIYAPNGTVGVNAGEWRLLGTSANLRSSFIQSIGQVYLGKGATIDVSGSRNVDAPVSQNIVEVDLRGAELADSPLQRDGKLRNASISVDLRDTGIYSGDEWIGTPLANLQGFANLVERGVGQLTVNGGTINISAGESVVLQEGSEVNVSGGSTRFEAGMIRTSRVISSGRLIDISQATPDLVYSAIYDGTFTDTNEKFGISKTYRASLAPDGNRFDPGGTYGASGGTLNITAPSMALDGNLKGNTTTGKRQRESPPVSSTLSLSFTARDVAYASFPIHAPTPPSISFQSRPSQETVADFSLDANGDPMALAEERRANVVLSSLLTSRDGFGSITIQNNDGNITIGEGVKLQAENGATLNFSASNITVDGQIIARGGNLTFSTGNISLDDLNALNNTSGASLPVATAERGLFTLGSSGSIIAAGTTVDDRFDRQPRLFRPLHVDGGSVRITSFSSELKAGGIINVSGGVWVNSTNQIQYGRGGSLAISAGKDRNLPALLGGTLSLGSQFSGFSGGTSGGSLSLTAPAIRIGGETAGAGVTLLDEAFFNRGGFSNFSINSSGLASEVESEFVTGVVIDSSARIMPQVRSLVADTSDSGLRIRKVTKAEGIRPTANLSFSSSGAANNFAGVLLGRGDTLAEAGSSIIMDAKGSVSFSGQTVSLLGSVMTPGGTIRVTGASAFPVNNGQSLLPTVLIGATANLDASGKLLLVPNPLGLRQGEVLAGGAITVAGNIVAESGAILDVSGTSGVLDLSPTSASLRSSQVNSTSGRATVPVRLASNGGKIFLSGVEMLYSDAQMIGMAGGNSATGGTVSVSSGRSVGLGTVSTTADANLVVRQDGTLVPKDFVSRGPGTLLTGSNGVRLEGIGTFSVATLDGGGFDSLNLSGNLKFDGDVSIVLPGSVKLATGGVIHSGGRTITVSASHVAIGKSFTTPALATDEEILFTRQDELGNTTPFSFAPTAGTGKLFVRAGLIDVGSLSLQGVGNTKLLAADGEVRGNGTLSAAGKVTFKAGQIYPTTASSFDVFVHDWTNDAGVLLKGSIDIRSGKLRQLPLSGGGTLSLYATSITQNGTLRAPIGTINLGWDGSGTAPVDDIAGTVVPTPVTQNLILSSKSVTSVSAIDPITGKPSIIPYGISLDGTSWIDPAGNDITVSGPPAKEINLSGESVITEEGSEIDIRGGGDLYAYRWISGSGGTKDILNSSTSFAIIPGYESQSAPFASFNSRTSAENLGGATGYLNSSLRNGDQITFGAGASVPEGTYTLLPARYALLKGAYLVTPVSGSSTNATTTAEGTSIVSGYRSNNLNRSRAGATSITRFEIAPRKVVRERAEYQNLSANTFLKAAAVDRDLAVPRLPVDAGQLSFTSTMSMNLEGQVNSQTLENGRGSLIDISSASNILINRSGRGAEGQLVLTASLVNQFAADSLLIGGTRTQTGEGTAVSINTAGILVDTKGSVLRSADLILVADKSIVLASDSRIRGISGGTTPENLILGNPGTPGSGDGVLVRASGSVEGSVSRSGISTSAVSRLEIGSGTRIQGVSITLDSSSLSKISSSARLSAIEVTLGSGRISLALGDDPGSLPSDAGLVLKDGFLSRLRKNVDSLGLRSYSSIDVYGTGPVGEGTFGSLNLQTASLRGFNQGNGNVVFAAGLLSLDNSFGLPAPTALADPSSGAIRFEAREIQLGLGQIELSGFDSTELSARQRLYLAESGTLAIRDGSLRIESPLTTGASAVKYRIDSAGALNLSRGSGRAAEDSSGGLGASLTLAGTTVSINSDIVLSSGNLSLVATTGNLTLGTNAATRIEVDGTAISLLDVTRFTGAGSVSLSSEKGDVIIGGLSTVSVSGDDSGGDAGMLAIRAPEGAFIITGKVLATAKEQHTQGSFSLDALTLQGGSLASLDRTLDNGSFFASRDYRIRSGDLEISGNSTSSIYRAAADSGNITVTGSIDASGRYGGTIDLKAFGSLTLASGASLDASGNQFDAAGKGGSITLEAGNQRRGTFDANSLLTLESGSIIDLSVASNTVASPSLGRFTGTLHLRAPRLSNNLDLKIDPIGSAITGASAIILEGVKYYAVSGTGTITSTIQSTIRNEANTFLGAAGVTTAGYTAMLNRLTSIQPELDLILAPGAEIYNLAGNLVLGTATSTATSDWNLATWRFGPNRAAGILTLRAAENLTLLNALSDGFNGGASLWQSPLVEYNPLLPANSQSWSFRLTAGADLSGASYRATRPLTELGDNSGMLELGKNAGAATASGGSGATTASLTSRFYQVIRTGSGNIDIQAGRDIRLLNPFASVYTAGTRLEDATKVVKAGDFFLPILDATPSQAGLGGNQQNYAALYSMAGGNVSISAGQDLERLTRNNSGLIDDSSRQLPNNWLYRRSYVGSNGDYGRIRIGSGFLPVIDPSASTTWWVDFSNFFQDVGALGGGNIHLSAGGSVRNIGASIPTNFRSAKGTPSASTSVELGGGDLRVTSGADISGGVYYVERGNGVLDAGGSIVTNSTRSPSFGLVGNLNNPDAARLDPQTWLPTTLFVGKSSFDLQAADQLILGPVANPFLLSQGLGNRFYYKTYFSTVSADSSVSAISLGGDVEYRNSATLRTVNAAQPLLQVWHESQLRFAGNSSTVSWFQPWLRLAETSMTPFTPVWSLSASSVSLTSLVGDINLIGNLTTSPSPSGQIEIVARGAINALLPTGFSNNIVAGASTRSWTSSVINLSDANPANIASPFKPLTSVTATPEGASISSDTVPNFMQSLGLQLTESGSFSGSNAVLQTRQARHTAGGLHRNDDEPLRIYALEGDISGLTLFSGKKALISAGNDITDVGLYIQNIAKDDTSVVTAGRDIVAYNSNSPLRVESVSPGNALASGQSVLSGDIQISGPGQLQVLAGRDIDLGSGSNNPDGTGIGISSIGNNRNPFLASGGADLVVGAGFGKASSLASSNLDLIGFAKNYVTTTEGAKALDEIAPGVEFNEQTSEEQARLAAEVFYLVLRDTGRNFNDPDSPGFGKYDSGFKAIKSLFPEETAWSGTINTQGRDIRTRSGGNIDILVPGGGVTMSETTIGNPLAPPGIITESGGNVSIFANDSVSIGIGRIFTLRGGDVMIWSSKGDIAAGSSSRTVQSAPPTRVVIDPQSAEVATDLAGLATGGGIGVLASVKGVEPSDVDLIAPAGIIDAGDAGIRVSGNINLAAVTVLNAGNISAGGVSSGTSAPSVSAPSISAVTTASNATAAAGAADVQQNNNQDTSGSTVAEEQTLSLITVEVIGYGGGSAEEEEEEKTEEGQSNESGETSGDPVP